MRVESVLKGHGLTDVFCEWTIGRHEVSVNQSPCGAEYQYRKERGNSRHKRKVGVDLEHLPSDPFNAHSQNITKWLLSFDSRYVRLTCSPMHHQK